jgi:anaerobic C4-dicarboxylate transporter DcuA/anaerobic C4-dicarboxylate transporter DcuB
MASVEQLPPTALRSAMIFLAGVAAIVVLGLFPELRPVVGDGAAAARVSVAVTIQIVMGCAAAMIFVTCKPKAVEVPKQSTFSAGMVSAIALFGLAWLAGAFVLQNNAFIVDGLSHVVEDHPLMFAVALGAVAMLTTSQAAATAAIVPVGLAVGLDTPAIVGMWAAVGAALILPTQGAQIAAVNFDPTGTTRIGSLVVNHSFQLPTLIYIVLAIVIAYPLAYLVY